MPSTSQEKSLLGSKTFNFKELFKNNYFVIPDYQRGYSWEQQQLKDLTEDIVNIANLDGKHYTGTIVASTDEIKPNTYELVDGQQRLTTLVIFLNEIYHSDKVKFQEIFDLFICRGSKGNEQSVFKPNLETRECFEFVVIRHDTFNPQTKSHEAIINAAAFFKDFLKKPHLDVERIYDTILTKLSFLFFTPEQTKEIGIMFEVINNRGKQLSELEKIKNFFIYYATVHSRAKLREEINSRWSDIQISLSNANRTSNDDENAFLRYCFLVFFKTNKEKSWHVYDQCKEFFDVKNHDDDYVNETVGQMRGFVDFIAISARNYSWFFSGDQFDSFYKGECRDELSKSLTYLRSQPTFASIMPLYLAITSRFDTPMEVVRLLELLEKLNMRLYVLPDIFRRADTKQADLFEFAWEFYNYPNWHSDEGAEYTRYHDIEIKGDIFEWLFQNLLHVTYAFCPYPRFMDNLELDSSETFNYYRWSGIRYFLANYEEYIRSKKAKRSFEWKRLLGGKKNFDNNNNDHLSIEHIWASKNMEDDFAADFHTKRRLGNFVLCSLSSNISLSNHSIPDKVEILNVNNAAGQGALDMIQVAELNPSLRKVTERLGDRRKTKNYWKELADGLCDDREADFKKFAFERWRLPFEKIPKE